MVKQKTTHRLDGFTIVELIIVIVVIGILATLITIGGAGYIKRSNEAALKTDLIAAAQELKKVESNVGTFPSELPDNIKHSENTQFNYLPSLSSRAQFCLNAEHSNDEDLKYYITDSIKGPKEGSCSGAIDAGYAQCSDGIDNDGDSKIDYPADPGCSSAGDNDETDLKQCADGLDNDGDGKVDYPADPGCEDSTDDDETDPPKQCADGLDNDGDGKVDYPADPGCVDAADDDEADPMQCSDGIDNDGDSKIDYPADPGCSSAGDNDETDLKQCADGLDNDGDGKVDYPADPGCVNAADDDELGPSSAATVSETGYNFPSWHIYNTGGSKPTRSFTFRNPANDAPLRLTTAAISGTDATSFSITYNGCANVTLQPNATCYITVQYYPPSGVSYNRMAWAGLKQATLRVNNSNSVAQTSVALSGKAYSDRMAPGDSVNAAQSLYFYPYSVSCYVNVESCGYSLTGIAANGNLYLGNTYCSFGGWGVGGYGNYYEPPGNSLVMQTDGNLVFYDPYTYRYASWTHGVGNLWLHVQPGGGVYLSQGSGGAIYKWIHHGGQCFAW